MVREAYPDPTDPDGRWVCVDLRAVAPLPRPVPLAAMKAHPGLADLPLLRQSRLSVSPVGEGYRWRVHVHTPDAGAAMDALHAVGEPTNVTITELSANGHQTTEIPQIPLPGQPAVDGFAREA